MKKFLYSLIFSIFILLFCLNNNIYAQNKTTYISLVPSFTEIIYGIKAQDNLVGVTLFCDYPKEAQNKPKIANGFFVNKEAIVKLKPKIIFALPEQQPFIDDLKALNIKIYYFSFKNLNDVYKNILKIGQLTGHSKDASSLVSKLNQEQKKILPHKQKKILYVVQAEPLISIGNKSFISDIIKKSGHINLTGNINSSYPKVNMEFAVYQKPDVIVVQDKNCIKYLKRFFNSRFVVLNKDQLNFINRPGPRVIEAVKFFAAL